MSQEEEFDWEEQLSVLVMRAAQGEAPRGAKNSRQTGEMIPSLTSSQSMIADLAGMPAIVLRRARNRFV